jgi:hypothetical protein
MTTSSSDDAEADDDETEEADDSFDGDDRIDDDGNDRRANRNSLRVNPSSLARRRICLLNSSEPVKYRMAQARESHGINLNEMDSIKVLRNGEIQIDQRKKQSKSNRQKVKLTECQFVDEIEASKPIHWLMMKPSKIAPLVIATLLKKLLWLVIQTMLHFHHQTFLVMAAVIHAQVWMMNVVIPMNQSRR